MTNCFTAGTGSYEQGDILGPIKIKDWLSWWPNDSEHPILLMTPACDIAQQKADFHRFCILQPFPLLMYKLAERVGLTPENWSGEEVVSRGKSQKIRDGLTRAVKNAWDRFHYLPKQEGFFQTDRIIDFELIGTIPLAATDGIPRIARLMSPHKEELIHRFSHHIMRIGTPDFSNAEIEDILSKALGGFRVRLAS